MAAREAYSRRGMRGHVWPRRRKFVGPIVSRVTWHGGRGRQRSRWALLLALAPRGEEDRGEGDEPSRAIAEERRRHAPALGDGAHDEGADGEDAAGEQHVEPHHAAAQLTRRLGRQARIAARHHHEAEAARDEYERHRRPEVADGGGA